MPNFHFYSQRRRSPHRSRFRHYFILFWCVGFSCKIFLIRHPSTSAPAPKDRSENAYLEGPGAPGKFYLTQNRYPGPENNKNPQPGHGHGRAPTRPPPSRSGLRLGVRTDEGQQTTTAKGQKVVSNGGHGGSNFFHINGTRGGGLGARHGTHLRHPEKQYGVRRRCRVMRLAHPCPH